VVPEFDWYQATVPHGVDDVLECLSGLDEGLKLSHARGHHGYAHTAVLGSELRGDVARVWHGGSHEYPHVVLSGHWAQPGAELIRASFPEHKVARVDVRQDFDGADAYDRMQVQLLDVAARCRVKVSTAGDHLLTMKGRTLYLGSPKADVRMRLYDKAEEMRSKIVAPRTAGIDMAEWYRGWGVPEHLTRLEAQIRPHTPGAKAAFATIQPVDALGSAAWMREVWKQIAGLDLRPVKVGKGWRQSDDERAYRYLLASYGGVLRRLQATLGSWECVGLQLGEDLRADSSLATQPEDGASRP